ncbi:hypothetical protein N878_10915 [Pseudomonas sp. EGD-AK9]|jgi:hypothetical protein|nr:hypothetical protein N878_10915 [Pseudomonas sp. EGD-AK9]
MTLFSSTISGYPGYSLPVYIRHFFIVWTNGSALTAGYFWQTPQK